MSTGVFECHFAISRFQPEEYANRVLPIVTPKLLDASANVRIKAFEVVHKSLGILKESHEGMAREAAATNGATTAQHSCAAFKSLGCVVCCGSGTSTDQWWILVWFIFVDVFVYQTRNVLEVVERQQLVP